MAGIRKETQRTQTVNIIGNAPAKRITFDKIGGELVNILQFKNYGKTPIFIGSLPTVTDLRDIYLHVAGDSGTAVISEPAGFNEIYIFSIENTTVSVNSFISTEIEPQNLFQMVPITIQKISPDLNISMPRITTPLIEHLSLPVANTWYSITLTNVSFCQISLRAPNATQWEVELSGTGLPLMMSQNQMYYMRDVLFTGTIRIRANAATQVAQIETWR